METRFVQDDGRTLVTFSPFTDEVEKGPHFPQMNTYVDSDLFSKWYEKVKKFLKDSSNPDSIVKPNSFSKNYDIAKLQIAKLKGILEYEQDTNVIERSNLRDFKIFIGHGHNMLWARLALYLLEELNIKSEYYESECRTGISIDETIDCFSKDSDIKFAILTLMKEDVTIDGHERARQNVIHELGIFRDKLGSKKVAIILEKGLEKPSNIDGIEYIEYSGDVCSVLFKLEKMLKREKLI